MTVRVGHSAEQCALPLTSPIGRLASPWSACSRPPDTKAGLRPDHLSFSVALAGLPRLSLGPTQH